MKDELDDRIKFKYVKRPCILNTGKKFMYLSYYGRLLKAHIKVDILVQMLLTN
jgi:hypothetical protein